VKRTGLRAVALVVGFKKIGIKQTFLKMSAAVLLHLYHELWSYEVSTKLTINNNVNHK
jgi:hypothetical protein